MSCVAKRPLSPRSPVMKTTARQRSIATMKEADAFVNLLAERSPDKLSAFAPLLGQGFNPVAVFREGAKMFEDDEELLAGFKRLLSCQVRVGFLLDSAALCRGIVSRYRHGTRAAPTRHMRAGRDVGGHRWTQGLDDG